MWEPNKNIKLINCKIQIQYKMSIKREDIYIYIYIQVRVLYFSADEQ